MGMLSSTEVLRLKLATIPAPLLRDLAQSNGIEGRRANELVKKLISSNIAPQQVDRFIKEQYTQKAKERQAEVSDDELLRELHKVETFQWGVVQGQLDNKIQVQYVRKYHRYENLLEHVANELYGSVKDYVICTWYNHWTTVIIEDLISSHPKVIPTLKNIKGVDLFFDGQPFDLKTTYMPAGYPNAANAVSNPKGLAVWLYENQGAQRFGADNRLFVILHDTKKPEDSWKIKRDINFIKHKIDRFFEQETISSEDEIVFNFQRQSYTAITKVLLIVK
jgi:hypothetical protein